MLTSSWRNDDVITMDQLRVKNKYPVPATSKEQEQLLNTVTDVFAVSWDTVMDIELEELQYQCSQTDIDYEFVIDSSGSIGEHIIWFILYDSFCFKVLPTGNKRWIWFQKYGFKTPSDQKDRSNVAITWPDGNFLHVTRQVKSYFTTFFHQALQENFEMTSTDLWWPWFQSLKSL